VTDRTIIWLASYPKSGSTWVRMLLACFLHDKPVKIANMSAEWLGEGEVSPEVWEHLYDKPAYKITDEEFAMGRATLHGILADPELRRRLPGRVGDLENGSIVVKTHSAITTDHGYDTITPQFTNGAIVVVRDPRDVAVSYAHHFGKTIEEAINDMGEQIEVKETGGLHYTVGSWSFNVISWTEEPGLPLLLVRYEDLHAKPKVVFRNILRFLDIKYTKERVARAVKYAEFSRLQKEEAKDGFEEAATQDRPFFRSGKVGGWRKTLTGEQAKVITERHGLAMRAVGYA
jgi:aryl sulfotransferase